MGNFIKTQSSFANGAVAPEFYTNDSINGLSVLQNMDVTDGGGLTRRPGLVRLSELNTVSRLIPFAVGDQEKYLLAIGDGHLYVLNTDGTLVHDVLVPWGINACPKIQYAQRFNAIIFVHPDYQPQILRKSGSSFTLEPFGFSTNDADLSTNIPFVRFDDSIGIKITISSNAQGNNYATLTTNKNFWTSNSVGTIISMLNKQWQITSYTDAKHVVAYVNGGYTVPSAAVSDWRESAFGARRGWPCSITFHQDRLVYGGSRDYPCGIWMSQVGRHNNFNVGTGLDDQAIFITLLSSQRQHICTVVSSDNLQILTTQGEWAVSNKPLTPSSVDIKQHTSVGSIAYRYLPPQQIEGATVFVSATGQDIRELSLDTLSEHYSATDLCAYAKHLMRNPIDIAYNNATHKLHIVLANGDMAVLNQNAALGISAWGIYKTLGQFISVAVIGGITYVIVQRDNNFYLEQFSKDALSDASDTSFTCIAAGIPMRTSGHNTNILRIRKITARVMDTKSLYINDYRAVLPNSVYDASSSGYSGDVSVNMLGTQRDFTVMPWRILCTESLPITVMSVTLYGFYTV